MFTLLTSSLRLAALLAVAGAVTATVFSGALSDLTPRPAAPSPAAVERTVDRQADRLERSARGALPERPSAGERRARVVRVLERLRTGLRALLVLGVLAAVALVACRLWARSRLDHERYRIVLYRNDTARPEQVAALFTAWHQILQRQEARGLSRLLFGQPHFGLELHNVVDDHRSIAVMTLVCPPGYVDAFDGRMASAYPDTRIGYEYVPTPQPIGLGNVPCDQIVRIKKDRLFLNRVATAEREYADPMVESVLSTMASLRQPMTVQLSIVPAFGLFERAALWMLRSRENRTHADAFVEHGPGLRGTAQNAEAMGAQQVAHKALFWVDIRVCGNDRDAVRQVAGALCGGRGENGLRRYETPLLAPAYQRRLEHATPKLLPSWQRGVFSAVELAALWQLPTPAAKNVRLRRSNIPRAPAPPEVARTPHAALPPAPTAELEPPAPTPAPMLPANV